MSNANLWGTDTNPAPPIHDEIGCMEWCSHCAVCGAGILYGARCGDHYGFYADIPTRHPFTQVEDDDRCRCGLPVDSH